MRRTLVVPAAGKGSRLGSALPKLLVEVAGRTMIDRILDLYAPFVDRAILVLAPHFLADVERHLSERAHALELEFLVQESPTGMLEAILIPAEVVRASDAEQIWITWCDQVAMQPRTLTRLDELSREAGDASLVVPTMSRADPYIHLVRNAAGNVAQVLHRREGDDLPATGEGDMGLFSLGRAAFLELLPQYSKDVVPGGATGERNFLPFLAWIEGRGNLVTFPGSHWMESVGVNTPEELSLVEAFLEDQR